MDVNLQINAVDENKRIAKRSRVLKGAKLVNMNNWSLVDCTIRDISETGARLICGDQIAVANLFRFFVPTDNTIQDARVVWRRGELVGIEFIGDKTVTSLKKF